MKICQVGPGIMSIPPIGWGAVEALIWDYYNILKNLGHSVDIVNTPNRNEIIEKVNKGDYDVVHIHYDHFYDVLPFLKCHLKIISSHYPYLNARERWENDGYTNKFKGICNNSDFWIFASSIDDINTYKSGGANPDKIFHSKLAIDIDSYDYNDVPEYKDRTFSLGKILYRKRQWLLQDINSVYFCGKKDYSGFNYSSPRYLGELNRQILNKTITKYANFILLSEMENATPLAVKEALVCGLGVVVSTPCALELDKTKDFITIIEEKYMDNQEYIKQKIEENKIISLTKRKEIREYALQNFSLGNIMKDYVNKIQDILLL